MSNPSQQAGATPKQQRRKTPKVVNDPIHGLIELPPACVAVIDTEEFQRLRFIKQLGVCQFVFPGATHTRFEHSLGVCHLAGQLVRTLQTNQPDLLIDNIDILCVQLAGLCHDLGHGPFSHMFDQLFIPKTYPEKEDWTHEKASIKLIDRLGDVMMNSGGLEEIDITFIKEMICGPLEQTDRGWPYKGRSEDKAFLYEIVSNDRTGIDVDKWDYFARDCHYLGIRSIFDRERFYKFMRVIKVNGRREICFRDKEVGNLFDMLYTRYSLHRLAYQHKVCRALDFMILDVLNEAEKFQRSKGEKLLSRCIDDMNEYVKLTDDVAWRIMDSTDDELSHARDILDRIIKRDLYKCIRVKDLEDGDTLYGVSGLDRKIKEKMIQRAPQDWKTSELWIHIQIFQADYGKGARNPLQNLKFYHKENMDEPVTYEELDEEGHMGLFRPSRFQEKKVRLYRCAKSDEHDEILKGLFEEAWDEVRRELQQAARA